MLLLASFAILSLVYDFNRKVWWTWPARYPVAQLAGHENTFDAIVVAIHQAQGTMACRMRAAAGESPSGTSVETPVELEAPLGRAEIGSRVQIAIRAGNILVAAAVPQKISARNVLRGVVEELRTTGTRVVARVRCGAEFRVDLTPGACESRSRQAASCG